jgi:N utilization substance protein B
VKTPFDPRHIKREKAVQALFAWSFGKPAKIENELAQKVLKSQEEIDQLITKTAPEWPIAQINKIDLAILRLAVYELTIQKKEPPKVIIDEAIELGKRFGSEKTPGFINGVLATVIKEKNVKPEKNQKS